MLVDQIIDSILYKAVTLDSALSSVAIPSALRETTRDQVLQQVSMCDVCNTWHMQVDMDEDEGVCYECLALA